MSTLTRIVNALERIADAVEQIAGEDVGGTLGLAISNGVLQMRDVDRAKVYSEHLGEKLRKE